MIDKYYKLIVSKNSGKKSISGFTLVEMIIAVSLFSFIASMSIGSVLMIFDVNRRSENSKTVVDNLNLSIEDMTRTIRFGYNYHCGTSGTLSEPNNCSAGSDSMAVTFKGDTVVYKKCGTSLKKSTNGQTNCNNSGMQSITSSDTVIEDLRFYVLGTGTSGLETYRQPYVIAVIKGYVGPRPTLQSSFFIQTMMSQRRIEYD